MKLNKIKENTMKQKDTILLIITIVISIPMSFSLVLSSLYVNDPIDATFWSLIHIISLFSLGSLAFIPLIIMWTHKFKEADKLNSSDKDFKTLKTIIRRKFKYVIIIFLYSVFILWGGTLISERAISTFLGPDIFPIDLWSFLFLTGLLMTFLSLGILTAIDINITHREKKLLKSNKSETFKIILKPP